MVGRPHGDSDQLMQAFVDLRPALHAFVQARIRPPLETDDIMQDLATRIAMRDPSGIIRRPSGYLFAMAGSVIRDRYRRGAARAEQNHVPVYDMALPDEAPTPEEATEARQRLERLQRAMAELPSELRDSFTAYRLENRTLAETASVLGLPVHKVRKNLERALARLSRSVWSD